MPSLKDLPDGLKRKKLTKALEKLGFQVDFKGGKGSHCKLTHIRSQKSITIPHNKLPKQVLYYILKEIKRINNIDWKDIKKHFLF